MTRLDQDTTVGALDAPAVGPGDIAPRWFAVLFAVAVGAHIVGNPPLGSGALSVVTALLGGAAVVLVHRPTSRAVWGAVAALVLATAWLEAPVIGNHWLLMGVFAAAVLVALLRREPWPWLATTVRLTFVSFYAFAAFAKLNTAFLDPAVSCAVHYANQGLTTWGLPALDPAGALAAVPIGVAVIVEVSVPLLLITPRTRAVGVAVAAAFHYAISLDVAQHFYDFTAVIFVGLLPYATDDVTARIDAWLQRRRATAVVTALWAVLAALAIVGPESPAIVVARLGVVALWIPLGAMIVWYAVRGAGRPAAVALRPPSVAAVLLIAIVVVNGVSPYLGVKTATSWNMYANLVTGDGRSNHLVVPATAQVADGDYVRVVTTDDEELAAYIGSGWLVPERNVRHHLAARPAATATFERSDGTRVTGSGGELGRPMSPLIARLVRSRSLDGRDPARCQARWLPAL